ncbi:MAG: DUF393 domain-containing protein [Deltaproteobacteria bacterium]|nr:MAG: DUF393 domain-containing protein [Deltaproteobacteria bacterium]
MPIPEFPLHILYDGACPVCSREIAYYRRLDRSARLVPVDISAPDFDPHRYGVPLAALMAELHAVDRRGAVYRGVGAFIAIWQAFPERRSCRWLAAIVSLPVVNGLARLGYRWFARVRPRLPGRRSGCATDACRSGRG